MGQQVDYAALAQQHGGTPDYAALAAASGGAAEPTFKTENLKDEHGDAVVDPNTIGTFLSHWWSQVNPVPLGQVLPFPKAIGGGGLNAPIKVGQHMLQSQGHLLDEAKQAYDAGKYTEAAGHAFYWLLPILGPILDKAGNELRAGKTAAGLGDTAGLATSIVGPGVIGRGISSLGEVASRTPGAAKSPRAVGLTPEEMASNVFAVERDIPLDAATATGNRFVRGVQKTTGESLLGSVSAERARTAQNTALARVGGELADQTGVRTATTAEQAGVAARESVEGTVRSLDDAVRQQYDKVAAAEADPRNALTVLDASGNARTVPLAVDLRPLKQAMRPVYDKWLRERDLGIPMQGQKGRALAALDGLMQSQDFASVSVVDQALSDLKALSRGALMPELRSAGQGRAALAVGELQRAVDAAVAKAGPDVLEALKNGRAAHRLKVDVGDLLDKVTKEPVKSFNELTGANDSHVGLLRRVAEAAPDALPQLARAWLDARLDRATEVGRFDHADALFSEWQKMGPETKRLLFPDVSHRNAIGHFMHIAKRLKENPNPSGTAVTAVKTGEVVGLVASPLHTIPAVAALGGISKLLHSPAGARALVNYLQRAEAANRLPPALRGSRMREASAELAKAARDVAPIAVQAAPAYPRAADSESPTGETR